jgi:predicted dehydrogenase
MKAISRALVVGIGSIGRRHLRLLREALPAADIRVLRHTEASETVEHADGCFHQLEEACNFAPELAVIANPSSLHVSTARPLAEVGAHLLIEKPISDTSVGIADLMAFCANRSQVLHVGYNLRFLECVRFFRDAIFDGRIGEVHTVRSEVGQFLPGWRPGSDYRKTVSAKKELGGGVLLELSHDLDILRWIFGEVEWLSAWTGRIGKLEINVEDSVMLQMSFISGPIAQLGMDFLRHDTSRRCTAIGEHGTLHWDAIEGTVKHYHPNKGSWTTLYSQQPIRDLTYQVQLEAFLNAIKGASSPIAAKGADGLAVVDMIEAVRLSDERDGLRVTPSDAS